MYFVAEETVSVCNKIHYNYKKNIIRPLPHYIIIIYKFLLTEKKKLNKHFNLIALLKYVKILLY